MRIVYIGPSPERELWGRVFLKGQPQQVDAALAAKALCLDGFSEAVEQEAMTETPPRRRGRPPKVTTDAQDGS